MHLRRLYGHRDRHVLVKGRDMKKLNIDGVIYSYEVKPATTERPDRIDVWRGVDWVGQWKWEAQSFGGKLREPNHRLPDHVKRSIERQYEQDGG